MEKPSTTLWILGAAATVAGFAAGYFTRARDLLRPGPGHVYRVGAMFFADEALVRRLNHQFPGAVKPRGKDGVLWIMPPGCHTLSLKPWDAPTRLPRQVGRIYRLAELREDTLRDVIEDWERAGIVEFVGAWSSWPEGQGVPPNEWAPPRSES